MRGWQSDLFLDMHRVAFQTSISLQIAACQKDYCLDQSERQQTPAPRCLQWKTSGSCHEHLSRVGRFCRACNFSKTPPRQPPSPSSSLNSLINQQAKLTSQKVLSTETTSPHILTPESKSNAGSGAAEVPSTYRQLTSNSPKKQ